MLENITTAINTILNIIYYIYIYTYLVSNYFLILYHPDVTIGFSKTFFHLYQREPRYQLCVAFLTRLILCKNYKKTVTCDLHLMNITI